ncbi:hypothetical protein VPH35_078079 [Triticum aestivum]|uniref:uncharacterized protein n=1 Tax=Triticum aestivum TaxID=4565 RepID=UPI001D01C2D9|nr:uncharacterized protein LOC123097481 [Triticum aestivum]
MLLVDAFKAEREELRQEIPGLKLALGESETSQATARHAQDDAAAKLASLWPPIKDVAGTTKQAVGGAGQEQEQRGHLRPLPSLELWSRGALSSICREKLEAPLRPHDVDFAEFSSKLVEQLKDGARKVDGILEECRDLFVQAAMHVFSHLLHGDPDFDFDRVIAPVPEAVGSHVDALLRKFSCGCGTSSDAVEEIEATGPTVAVVAMARLPLRLPSSLFCNKLIRPCGGVKTMVFV